MSSERVKVLFVDFKEDRFITLAANEVLAGLRSKGESFLDIIPTNGEDETISLLKNPHIQLVVFINGGLDAKEFFQLQIELLVKHKLIVLGGYGAEILNKYFFRRADLSLRLFQGSVSKILKVIDEMEAKEIQL